MSGNRKGDPGQPIPGKTDESGLVAADLRGCADALSFVRLFV
jgi:hypothetical protein